MNREAATAVCRGNADARVEWLFSFLEAGQLK